MHKIKYYKENGSPGIVTQAKSAGWITAPFSKLKLLANIFFDCIVLLVFNPFILFINSIKYLFYIKMKVHLFSEH